MPEMNVKSYAITESILFCSSVFEIKQVIVYLIMMMRMLQAFDFHANYLCVFVCMIREDTFYYYDAKSRDVIDIQLSIC